MSRVFPPLVALSAALLPATPADACPVCNREAGKQVRAGLFDEGLGVNVAATVLPFGVFLGIAAAIHFGPPRRRGVVPAPGRDAESPPVA